MGHPDAVVAAIADECARLWLSAMKTPCGSATHGGRAWRDARAGPLLPRRCRCRRAHISLPREEYAARTIRPKIHKLWDNYLNPLPTPTARYKWPVPRPAGEAVDPEALVKKLRVGGAPAVANYHGGSREAMRGSGFSCKRVYHTMRPGETSRLPTARASGHHLHFGQINPVTIPVFEVLASASSS